MNMGQFWNSDRHWNYPPEWHGITVSMMACVPEYPGSIPRHAKVRNHVIFFLGVFMIQFNLI